MLMLEGKKQDNKINNSQKCIFWATFRIQLNSERLENKYLLPVGLIDREVANLRIGADR